MSAFRPAQHRNIPRGSLRSTARDRVHVCCGQRKATCSSSGRGARSPGRDCAGPGLLLRAPCSRGRPPGFLSLACAIRAHTTRACKPQCPAPGTSDGPVVSVKGRRGRSTGYACLVLGDEDPQYAGPGKVQETSRAHGRTPGSSRRQSPWERCPFSPLAVGQGARVLPGCSSYATLIPSEESGSRGPVGEEPHEAAAALRQGVLHALGGLFLFGTFWWALPM